MVLFDVPFAFFAGSVIGWRGQGRVRDLALLYAGAGVAAPGVWYLEVYPAWDWQYLLDPAILPAGYEAVFAALAIFAGLAGHEAGSRSVKAVAGMAAFLAVYLVISTPRMLYVSDYATWAAGDAPMLPMDFLLNGALVMGMSGVLGAYCLYRAEQARDPAAAAPSPEGVAEAEAA